MKNQPRPIPGRQPILPHPRGRIMFVAENYQKACRHPRGWKCATLVQPLGYLLAAAVLLVVALKAPEES